MKTFFTFFFIWMILCSFLLGQEDFGKYEFTSNSYNVTSQPYFGMFNVISTTGATSTTLNSGGSYYLETAYWPTSTSKDENYYLGFSLTLNSPYNFNGISLSLSFDNYINDDPGASGPMMAEVMYRFGNSGSFSSVQIFYPQILSWLNNQFSIPNNNSNQTKIEIRIYGWYAFGDGQYRTWYFDNIVLKGNDVPLPYELTSFTANVINNSVILNWQTATETDNYGFDVERVSVKNVWEKIGFVNGSGNSNSPKDYSFTDKTANAGKYTYRLKQIDANGSYHYSSEVEVDLGVPVVYGLEQNYPNPFNPATKISYQIPVQSAVQIDVFNSIGEKVAELVNEVKEAGYYEVEFNAASLSSGIYFYSIKAGDFVFAKKMMMVK